MENLNVLHNHLKELTDTVPTNQDPNEENAALNYHMKNMYGVLTGLTTAIAKLGENTVTKEDLTNELKPLNNKVEANTSRISALEKKNEELAKTQDTFIPGMSKEIDQRLKKQNNVIIINLKESNKTENNDKKKDDLRAISELLKDVDMGENAITAVKTLFRLRKPKKGVGETNNKDSDKPKPLVVVFKDIKYKENLFKNAHKLKGNIKWKKLSIKPDKTSLQRHCDKAEYENQLKTAAEMNMEMERDEYAKG